MNNKYIYYPKSRRLFSAVFDFYIGTIICAIIHFLLLSYLNIKAGLYLVVFYFVIIPILTNGQTFGYYIFKLRIVSENSKKLKLFQIIFRQLFCWVGFNYIFDVIGLQKLTNNKNQLIHDKFFKTLVISV